MAIADLTTLDIVFLMIDVVVLVILAGYYYKEGDSFRKCRKIELNENDLRIWRIFLYTVIFATWIIAAGIFIEEFAIRHLLHLFILFGMNTMFRISIPAFVCKKKGFGGTCNCDFYLYNDFYPMLALATIGNLVIAFGEWTLTSGLTFIIILVSLSGVIFFFMPKRELKPLKYPVEMLITEIDSLQAYLMDNPHQKKLLTVLDAKCDFCEIQVQEILEVNPELRETQLRIFDLTFVEQMDPYIPMTLNMNTDEKIPVPTTFIFDAGMAIEQRDGVLSRTDIEFILST